MPSLPLPGSKILLAVSQHRAFVPHVLKSISQLCPGYFKHAEKSRKNWCNQHISITQILKALEHRRYPGRWTFQTSFTSRRCPWSTACVWDPRGLHLMYQLRCVNSTSNSLSWWKVLCNHSTCSTNRAHVCLRTQNIPAASRAGGP